MLETDPVPVDAVTLDSLVERYTPEPVPPCPVCGEPLTKQAEGGGHPTAWGCSPLMDDPDRPGWLKNKPGRGGREETHPEGHYARSHFTQYRRGDSDVLAVVAEIRRCWTEMYPHHFTSIDPLEGLADWLYCTVCKAPRNDCVSMYCAERHKRALEEGQP